ncbi:hypothetical protein Nepgr_007571 [Nepenthes gracilis]|uniref:Pentatricopeptide repeat-containing protein n=1 Tax=Nepenthes gracilis TaxID=150966 RepID=A0AAD3XIM8_NEPGR|nr:hypothetical protein Nepgr_007571 [Nepenthes gracilis]
MVAVCYHLSLNKWVQSLLEKCSAFNHLKQLQAFLITLGHGQTQFFAFKLIRCAVSLANLEYARFIFNHLSSPNVYLYSAMITAYASHSDHRSVLWLYRNLFRQGCFLPNEYVYPHVLKSSLEVFDSNGTESVHTQIMKSGFGLNAVVQTALIDSYSRFSSGIWTARQIFEEMLNKNVVSWTAMISGYSRYGEMGNAILLFEEMPLRDVPSWNAIIAGCVQNGMFMEAIFFFRKMLNLTVTQHWHNLPNEVTSVCALSACGHTGMLQLGKWIHVYILKNSFGPCSFISNALVDMYGKCGNLRAAKNVFDKMRERGLTSWNSMINSYALHGQCWRAVDIFEKMIQSEEDVKPDEITFVSLLNACTHGGLVEKGYFYFDLMSKVYGIEPHMEHYGCLIDLLGRAGWFGEAMEVISKMKIEPDEVIWGSLLNGCKIHGNTDLAEFVIRKLIEIDPNNGGYIIMLANLYVKLARWDEVVDVRKMLKESNAQKIPGCSWIEVDSQVHQFHSACNKHPKTEEIYAILESLGNLADVLPNKKPLDLVHKDDYSTGSSNGS